MLLSETDAYSSSEVDVFYTNFLVILHSFSVGEFQQEKQIQILSETKRHNLYVLSILRYFQTAASAHF